MTLIAAFRTNRGAVICADSKETQGGYYVQVDKIERLDLGAYEAVIGGAGNEGSLIDGLTDVLADSIQTWAAGLKESAIKNNVRYVLTEYYKNEVKHFTARRQDKFVELVICIKGKESEDVFLWRTDRTTLKPIKDFALIGFNTALYEYEAGRLYGRKRKPSVSRAVALGVHLLALAKATCDWVGGDTRIVAVNDSGMRQYQPDDVDVLENSARKFSGALAELTLALPDVTITKREFRQILGAFEKQVLSLRGYYLENLARSFAEKLERAVVENTPLTSSSGAELITLLPVNTTIPYDNERTLRLSRNRITIAEAKQRGSQSVTPPSETEQGGQTLDSETSEGQP